MPRPPSLRKLSALIGHPVVERLAASTETGEALYLDARGVLHRYADGELAPPGIAIHEPGVKTLAPAEPGRARSLNADAQKRARAAVSAVARLVKRHGRCVERRALWKGKRAAKYHDLARHGPLVLWRYGYDNGQNLRARIVECSDDARARWFLLHFAAKQFVATDGYYVPGLGAINRSYGKQRERVLRGVAGRAWFDFSGREVKRFASAAAAQLAFNKWEHKQLCGGWQLFNIELDRRAPDPHAHAHG